MAKSKAAGAIAGIVNVLVILSAMRGIYKLINIDGYEYKSAIQQAVGAIVAIGYPVILYCMSKAVFWFSENSDDDSEPDTTTKN